MVSDVHGVIKLINQDIFNMNPSCWRGDGLSTPFPNSGVKYDVLHWASDSLKISCMYGIISRLGSLVSGS